MLTSGRTAKNGDENSEFGIRAAVNFCVLIDVTIDEVPSVCTTGVAKLQEAPGGNPAQLRLSASLKPLLGVTVIVVVAVCPPETVKTNGAVAIAKSGMGAGIIVTIIGVEEEAANAAPAAYEAVSESAPIGRVVVVIAAEPSFPKVPEPINVLPFKKLTAP